MSTEGSLLEKLLKTRYPLTNYLYRQQEFIKIYPTTQSAALPTPPPPPPVELTTIAASKRKTSLPALPWFNVPDTLDFNTSGYEQNNEMEDDVGQEFDDTLLKNIDNRITHRHSDLINGKNTSIIQRSSAIQLEFSPYEHNSPLRKAIENGLNIINK